MSQRASEGLGKRLAKYRRLAGLSARELAERAGMGLSRGVIANIESGRKSDITVDQLIALSTVLGVPPVVLALPVDQPEKFVRLVEARNGIQATRAYQALEMFQAPGANLYRRTGMDPAPDNEAALLAEELIRAVQKLPKARLRLAQVEKKLADGSVDESVVSEDELELAYIERTLRQLGADLTQYKIDD